MRWAISIVCLVLLGAALMAAAQTPAAGSSQAPLNVQIVKAIGEDSSDNTAHTGAQAEIWVNWTIPVNQLNSAPIDYQLTVAPSTGATYTATCTQLTGVALCYGAILRYFDQGITPGSTYTISVATVNAYGAGQSTAAAAVRVPLNGNPDLPTGLAASYTSPNSFLLTFNIPKFIGQAGVNNASQLVSPYFEAQIKTATSNWWVVNSCTFSNPVPFAGAGLSTTGSVSTPIVPKASCLVDRYTNGAGTLTYLASGTSYSVRVRAVGQYGRGGWSNGGITISSGSINLQSGIPGLVSVTTTGSSQSPNGVDASGISTWVSAANGGVIAWSNVPSIVGAVAASGVNHSTISAYNVYIAPKCIAATGACAGTASNVGTSSTNWIAATGSVALFTTNGRVTGGRAWINNATRSGFTNNTNVNGDQYWVQITATNSVGEGTKNYVPSLLGTLTISTTSTTIGGTVASIQTCWAVTPAAGATPTTCNFNFNFASAANQQTVNSTIGGGAIVAALGGFSTSTPFVVTAGTAGTLTGSLSAVPVTGPTTSGSNWGSFTVSAITDFTANSKPVITIGVQGGTAAAVTATTTTINAAQVAQPGDNNTANTSGATFLQRDGSTAAGGANYAYLTVGTDFAVMNIVRPTTSGLFVAGTTGTPPNFTGIGYFTATAAAAPTYANVFLPATNGVAYLNGASATGSLSAASWIVAVRTAATANNRFVVGFANQKTLGITTLVLAGAGGPGYAAAPALTVGTAGGGAVAATASATLTTGTAGSAATVGAGTANSGYKGNLCPITATDGTGAGSGFLGYVVMTGGNTVSTGAGSVVIVNPGVSYPNTTTFAITTTGACTYTAGTVATFNTATLSSTGGVTGLTVATAGSGYVTNGASAGICSFNTAAGAGQATGILTLANGAVPAVGSFVITNGGSGLTGTPAITINCFVPTAVTGMMSTGANAGTTINVTSTANITVGMVIAVTGGAGAIGAGTTVASITNATSLVASAAPGTAFDATTVLSFTATGPTGYTVATLGNPIASISIVGPGSSYTASANVAVTVAAVGGVTAQVGTGTAAANATTAGTISYTNNFYGTPSADAGAGAATFATGATSNSNITVGIVDISDTAANLLITIGGAGAGGTTSTLTWTANVSFAASGGLAESSGVITRYNLSETNNVTSATVSYTSPTGTACVTTTGNLLYSNQYTCQVTGFIPGRQYTLNNAAGNSVQLQLLAAAASVNVVTSGSPFWTASVRPSSAILTGSKGAYFIGLTSAWVYYQLPTNNVGQGAIISSTINNGDVTSWATAVVTQQLTAGPSTAGVVYPQLQLSGGYGSGTTYTANANNSNPGGNWGKVQVRGLAASSATAGATANTYTITVYGGNQINQDLTGSTVSVTTNINDAVRPGAPSVTNAVVRFITSTSAWLDWEAPQSIGNDLNGAPADTAYTASLLTTDCSGTLSLTPFTTNTLIAGTVSSFADFRATGLLTGLVMGNQSSCSIGIVFNNAGNSANTASPASAGIAVTLQAATGTVAPATPTVYGFDQVSSGSYVVGFSIPNTWGTGSPSVASNPTTSFAFQASGGSVSTLATALLGTTALNNAAAAQGSGFIPASFYGLFNIYVGAYQQVIGITTQTTPTTVNVLFSAAAATSYTVSIKASLVAANANQSSAVSGSQTTAALGDVPSAPTGVTVSRVTSTSVRLTFSRPIVVGGDDLCTGTTLCATGTTYVSTVPFRAFYIQGTPTLSGNLPTNKAFYVSTSTPVAVTAQTFTFYSTSTAQPTANGGSQPWYGPNTGAFLGFTQQYIMDLTGLQTTTSTTLNFYVCADNQFSTAFNNAQAYFSPAGCTASATTDGCTGNTTAYNAITCNPSTVVSQQLTTASKVPDAVTDLTVTQYGWNFFTFSFTGPQIWGGTGTQATYTVERNTVSTGGTWTTVGTAGSAYVAQGDGFTAQDLSLTVPNGAATQFFYRVTISTGASLSTVSNVFQFTTQATGDAPLAPAAPTITGGAANSNGTNPNFVQDVAINLSWKLPLGIGGNTVNTIYGFTVTQSVAQQASGSATPTPSRALANCVTTYTWQTNSSGTTSPVVNFTFSGLIPNKTYTYSVVATSLTNPTAPATAVYQSSPASAVLSQKTYPIVAPWPAPSLAVTTKGSGYITFALSFPNNYNLGPAQGTQYNLTPTTLFTGTDAFPAPLSSNSLNWYTGVQLLQQSNLPSNANTTAFVPDTFIPQVYGAIPTGLVPTTSTPISVNGLKGATNYRFSVIVFNGYYYTQATTPVFVTTNASVIPGQVISMAVNQERRTSALTTSPSIWLQWSQPLETGGEGFVTNWTVKYGLSAASSNSTVSVNSGAMVVSTVINSGLTDNTRYYVTVVGTNSKGTSIAGTFATAQIDNGASNIVRTGQIPFEPTTFAITANSGTSVDFSWVLPSNNAALAAITGGAGSLAPTNQIISGSNALAGQAIAGSTITFTAPGITQPSSVSATSTTAGSITVANGQFYRFSIYNTNPLNNGNVVTSTSINVSLGVYLQATPSASTTAPVPTAVTSFQLDYSAITEYRVSFVASAGTSTVPAATYFYVIYWQQIQRFYATQNNPTANDGGSTNVVVTASSTVTLSTNLLTPAAGNVVWANCAQIFNAIRPSSKYNMVVIPANSNGLGPMTPAAGTNGLAAPLQPANATPGPQPGQPDAPTQTANPTDNTISIGWTTPASQGLAQVQYYIVQATPSNGGSGNQVTLNVSAATGTSRLNYNSTVNGLSAGTQYDMNVTGYNSFGQGIPSASTQITTTGNAGFAAASSLWTVVLMAVAALFAFAF